MYNFNRDISSCRKLNHFNVCGVNSCWLQTLSTLQMKRQRPPTKNKHTSHKCQPQVVLSSGINFDPTVYEGTDNPDRCSTRSSARQQLDPPLPVGALMCITDWMSLNPSNHVHILRQSKSPPTLPTYRIDRIECLYWSLYKYNGIKNISFQCKHKYKGKVAPSSAQCGPKTLS